MDNNWKLGLIGCGNMGSALVSGVTQSSVIDADRIWIFDVDKNKTALIRDRKPVHIADSNADLLGEADTIVLAVKPQIMQNVLEEIRPYAKPEHLFISVAAGVPIRMYERFLGPEIRIVRTMPNIPCLISRGATAVTAGRFARQGDLQRVLEIFNSIGLAYEVEEKHMDAVTGLSGTGPAYIFHLVEALTAAGSKLGLAPAVATALSYQTVLGAAHMIAETGLDPAELRRRVTSPNGTTEAALKILSEADFMGLIERTVFRATQRSEELGRVFHAPHTEG